MALNGILVDLVALDTELLCYHFSYIKASERRSSWLSRSIISILPVTEFFETSLLDFLMVVIVRMVCMHPYARVHVA